MFGPRSVQQLSPFDRGKGCGEGAKKERCSHPKGEFRGPSAGAIDSSLRFYNNIVHTLLGICLT